MGGDHAPRVTVAGAVAAARSGVAVILVGREAEVRAHLQTHLHTDLKNAPDTSTLPIEVVDATEVVEMDEHPATAVRRKRNASIAVAARLVAEGRADALYSAG